MKMKSLAQSMILAGFAALALLPARPARGQLADSGGGCEDEEGSEGSKQDAGTFRKIEKNGQVTYEYTGVIRVCGKVPKPNVVVILLERTVDYEWERLKQDFLPRIHESLERAPF